MGNNAFMHDTARRNLPLLRKDRPKEVLDDYFKTYERKHRAKLSETALADMMVASGFPINQSTINRIRRGTLYPDIETSLKFSTFLGIDFLEFIGLEFWAPPPPNTLTAQAKEVAKAYDDLPKNDRAAIDRVLAALQATAKKPEPVKR